MSLTWHLSTGHLSLPPGTGGAGFHRATGLQPEGAAGLDFTEKSAFLHRGEVCQANRNTAKEKVSITGVEARGDAAPGRSPACPPHVAAAVYSLRAPSSTAWVGGQGSGSGSGGSSPLTPRAAPS